MPQGWTPGPIPDTSAWTPGPAPGPDFRTSNETDAQGNPVIAGLSHAWQFANTPLVPQIAAAAHAIADHLDQPKLDQSETLAKIKGFFAGATGAAGDVAASFTSPVGLALTLAGVGEESAVAKAVPALRNLLALPAVKTLQRAVQTTGGVGFMAHGADRVVTAPDVAGKLGGAAEMAAGALGASSALRDGVVPGAAPVSRLTPAEAGSNAFATARGIPLDAATATGSRFVRGVQKVSGESLFGGPAAERAQTAQAAALTRVGGDLADSVHPSPVTSEQAGSNISGAIKQLLGDLNTQATNSYDTLRTIEADPRFAERVHTAPYGSREHQRILSKLAAGTDSGQAPADAELRMMRSFEQELAALPYQQGKLVADNPGVDSTTHYVAGHAGSPIYQAILDAAPGTSAMTRGEVQAGIRKTLETGDWNDAARGAFVLAKKALAGGDTRALGMVPPNTPLLGTAETVNLPVALHGPKKALAPLYQRLLRESELVPLQGDKGRALVALDRLMNGPDYASASVVDGALGDLKSMARSDVPELRTAGQGLAASAVKYLDQAVQHAVGRAGPKAVQALTEGRAATVAKYQTGDVLQDVAGRSADAEPVAIVRRLTAPKDASIQLLRRVQEVAPQQMPEVARAKLEDLLNQATERGRFDHADKLYAEWQKLGSETKQVLFPQPGQHQALDHFFLLAKRIAENPNASGTAPTLIKTGEAVGLMTHPLATLPPSLTMGALSKLLYTQAGVRALTRLMALRATSPTTLRSAAQTAGWAELAAAARAAGFPLGVPATADSTSTGDQGR